MSSLFSWINAIDGGIVAAGDQVTTLPASYLQDPKIQKVWRSGVSTSTYVTVDLRAPVALGVVGLFGMNLAATDTVRIRLSNVALGSSELLDTGVQACNAVTGYNQYVYIPATPITVRYIRIDINAASRAALGNFDIGRAWAGPIWTPTIQYSLGWGEQWEDTSNVIESERSGLVFIDAKPKRRTLSYSYDFLSPADRAQAQELDRVAGKSSQILFVRDTEGALATEPLLGRLTDTSKITQEFNSAPAVYAKPYTIRQDL